MVQQNYLAFESVSKHLKIPTKNNLVMVWKYKGSSYEVIEAPATLDNSLNPRLDYFNNLNFK